MLVLSTVHLPVRLSVQPPPHHRVSILTRACVTLAEASLCKRTKFSLLSTPFCARLPLQVPFRPLSVQVPLASILFLGFHSTDQRSISSFSRLRWCFTTEKGPLGRRTCVLRFLCHTLAHHFLVSPLVGMLILSRDKGKVSSYIPLVARHSPDTIVARRALLRA